MEKIMLSEQDKRIKRLMEQREIEINALKKILHAFDNTDNERKTDVKPKES